MYVHNRWQMPNLPEIFPPVWHFFMMACSPCMKAGQAYEPGVEFIPNSRSEALPVGFQDLLGLKMTTVKSPFFTGLTTGIKLSCLYLQCGHHQILNPQGLPFDLSAVSLHYLPELYWQEYMGPERYFKELLINILSRLFKESHKMFFKDNLDRTCNFNGTFRKPGWRIPTHIAYTASPVPTAIWATPHPPRCLVLSSAKAWSVVSSSIPIWNVWCSI